MARDDLKAKVVLGSDTSGAEKGIKRVEGSFRRFSKFLSSKFVITLGDVTRAFSAITGSIRDSAALEGQTQALASNLAAQGVALDSFLANLERVSQGQIAQADLIASSSRAILLGIPADKIAELLEVAAASAIATGSTITKAFEDIAIGIGRASPLILDNLGIVVKLGPTYAAAAASLGKTVEELTPLEQKMALLNSVLEVGAERIATFGDAQSEPAKALHQSAAAFEDMKVKAGQFAGYAASSLLAVLLLIAEGVARASSSVVDFGQTVLSVGAKVMEFQIAALSVASKLPLVGGAFAKAAEGATAWRDKLLSGKDTLAGFEETLDETAESLAKYKDKISDVADTQFFMLTGIDMTNKGLAEEKRRLADATAAAGDNAEATGKAADEAERLAEAAGEEATTLDAAAAATGNLTAQINKLNIAQIQQLALAEKKQRLSFAERVPDPLFPGLSGATFSINSFTPWAEMNSAQRERFIKGGGTPPGAPSGWTEGSG